MAILNFFKKNNDEEVFPSQPLKLNPESIPSPTQAEPKREDTLPKSIPALKIISMPEPEQQTARLARAPDAIYVNMGSYNLGHSHIITLERNLQAAIIFINRLNSLKNETDKTVMQFYEALEDAQRKLVHIDKKLFKTF